MDAELRDSLESGLRSIAARDWSAAESLLVSAVNRATALGDLSSRARALGYLSIAFEKLGRSPEAVEALAKLLLDIEACYAAGEFTAPITGMHQAWLYLSEGMLPATESLCRSLLEYFDSPKGFSPLDAGHCWMVLGRVEELRKVYGTALYHYERSLEYLRRCEKFWKSIFGLNLVDSMGRKFSLDLFYAATMNDIAIAKLLPHEFAGSVCFFERAAELVTSVLGDRHAYALAARKTVLVLREDGDSGSFEESRARVAAVWEGYWVTGDLELAVTKTNHERISSS